MLVALSIRNIVLVDRLELALQPGLCVLTGETGAGKSILLDALGLTLGARADSALVRHGAEQATITSEFEISGDHPARRLLAEQGLDEDGSLVLRRTLTRDGRSRAFVNDQPVSAGLLRQLGATLVEIQGQFEQHGLLDATSHRGLLDGYGGLTAMLQEVGARYRAWRDAGTTYAEAAAELARARADEEFLRHAWEELDTLNPQPDEDSELAETRSVLMNREKLVEALNAAYAEMTAGRGADGALRAAQRQLERTTDKAGVQFDDAIAALERAAVEAEEALAELQAVSTRIETESTRLEQVEERLFALRAAARKHRVGVEALPALRDELATKLAAVKDQDRHLAGLAAADAQARDDYLRAAKALNQKRQKAAAALDKAVAAELPPLKLEKASFHTRVEPAPEDGWGENGIDRVDFAASTNPGTPLGPLARVASGGELSRFMLALRVVLSRLGTAPTLIFDEVDAGIGGAVAAAVGGRLARLSEELQVLVVTHSPQVAARGGHHWRVLKVAAEDAAGGVRTRVDELPNDQRREEIARMLSGARITDEARAAADSLMTRAEP
jgi:DNA repair protein RecN (Recombination protein N)